MPNTADLLPYWLVMSVILLVVSTINWVVTVYRGMAAKRKLHEEHREEDWYSGPQKLLWQRIALLWLFVYKGILFTALGVLIVYGASGAVRSTVFGLGILALLVMATTYQVAVLVMRPGIDDDIIRSAERDNIRRVASQKDSTTHTAGTEGGSGEVTGVGLEQGQEAPK